MKTTVIGNYPKTPNYPREAKIRKALHSFDKKEIMKEALDAVFDDATIEAMREMENAGIDVITDGQMRWNDELTPFAGKLSGIDITGLTRFYNNNAYYRQPLVKGPISWNSPALARDFEFAKKNAKKPVKAVLTGPHTLAYSSLDTHYNDFQSLAKAYAEALKKEANALSNSGASIIQVNEVPGEAFYPELIDLIFDGIGGERILWTYYYAAPESVFSIRNVETIGLDFVEAKKENIALLEKGVLGERTLGCGVIDSRNTKRDTLEMVKPVVRKIRKNVSKDKMILATNSGLDYLPRENAEQKLKDLALIARQL